MLQALRSRAAGVVVKILFGILVLSFAVWGIGDYSFLKRGESTALRIGDVGVPATTLEKEYRSELDRLRRATQGQVDSEMARQFGLLDQVIDRLVTRTLLDKTVERLGVRIGDDLVRTQLRSAPALQGPGGEFDRARLQQVLYESGLSEAGFIASYRQDVARGMVVDALVGGGRAPDFLAERLYRYRNERRAGDAILVPSASFGDVGTPDAAQIDAIYNEQRDRFTAPEYRALTVVRVGPDEVMSLITIDEAQLRDEYQTRVAELGTPERREVQQLLIADEATAKTARAKIAGGTPFADVAREAGQAEQSRLGLITRDDLPSELAAAVFALPANGISEPVRSSFGWHVFQVGKIEAAQQPTFADLKDQLLADAKQRAAHEAAYDYATKVEDALANGNALDDAAAKAGLKPIKVAAADMRGRSPSGEPVAALTGAGEALTAAFEIPAGRETPLIEGQDGIWFIVRADDVTPAHLRPLDEVRNQIVELWRGEKRAEAAKARADLIHDAIKSGRAPEAAAGLYNLKPTPIAPTPRTPSFDRRASVPFEVTAQLFALKPGESAVVPASDGVYVVRLTQIVDADPAANKAEFDAFRTQLNQQIGSDVLTEFTEALRRRYGVTIDKSAVGKIL